MKNHETVCLVICAAIRCTVDELANLNVEAVQQAAATKLNIEELGI